MHKKQGWPQAWEYGQAKPIQTFGRVHKEWTEAGVSVSSRNGLPSHFWNRDNIRSILPGLRRKITGLLLSGLKSFFQISSQFCISFGNRGPRVWRKSGEAHNLVRVLSLRSSVIHGFVTEPWYSHHVRVFMWARGFESCALSSACLVSCWSVVFGSRHSCFEFLSRDGVRTLALHFLSLCECAVSSSLGTAHSCPRVFCCVARSSCFYRLRAFMLYLVLCGRQLVYSLAVCFHVVMSCVNTWLMSFLISCVFMSCFAHGWWFFCWPCACVSVLCEHVASVLVFCVPRAHVNLSWPHPSCYLFIDSFSPAVFPHYPPHLLPL